MSFDHGEDSRSSAITVGGLRWARPASEMIYDINDQIYPLDIPRFNYNLDAVLPAPGFAVRREDVAESLQYMEDLRFQLMDLSRRMGENHRALMVHSSLLSSSYYNFPMITF